MDDKNACSRRVASRERYYWWRLAFGMWTEMIGRWTLFGDLGLARAPSPISPPRFAFVHRTQSMLACLGDVANIFGVSYRVGLTMKRRRYRCQALLSCAVKDKGARSCIYLATNARRSTASAMRGTCMNFGHGDRSSSQHENWQGSCEERRRRHGGRTDHEKESKRS